MLEVDWLIEGHRQCDPTNRPLLSMFNCWNKPGVAVSSVTIACRDCGALQDVLLFRRGGQPFFGGADATLKRH
jgi:hypothetical protein